MILLRLYYLYASDLLRMIRQIQYLHIIHTLYKIRTMKLQWSLNQQISPYRKYKLLQKALLVLVFLLSSVQSSDLLTFHSTFEILLALRFYFFLLLALNDII